MCIRFRLMMLRIIYNWPSDPQSRLSNSKWLRGLLCQFSMCTHNNISSRWTSIMCSRFHTKYGWPNTSSLVISRSRFQISRTTRRMNLKQTRSAWSSARATSRRSLPTCQSDPETTCTYRVFNKYITRTNNIGVVRCNLKCRITRCSLTLRCKSRCKHSNNLFLLSKA